MLHATWIFVVVACYHSIEAYIQARKGNVALTVYYSAGFILFGLYVAFCESFLLIQGK